jgi:drug/metabolite transporter (DMT)-like permease
LVEAARVFVSNMPAGLRGMMFMFVATISGICMHVTVRHMSAEIEPFELAFFRNFLALLFLIVPLVRLGLAPLRTHHLKLHLLRGSLTTASMLGYFTALSITPLAQVTALAFTAPLFATVLAIVVLGEVVGVRRWSAIAIGFAGTLVILRPGIVAFDLGSMLTIFSAATWGSVIIITRVLGRTESSHTITFYLALIMTVLSFLPATYVWIWPEPHQYFWLFLMAALGTVTQLSVTQALRLGETAVVMPIDFFKLIWATAFGYFLFAERPDAMTLVGGGMIFVSATYIAYRESKSGQRSKLARNK